jgi:hypothetical protein
MASFRYRLETLLEQKQEAKAAAEQALALRRAEERRAAAELERLQGHVNAAAERKRLAREGAFVDGDTIENILARRGDIAIYTRQLDEAKDEVLSHRLYMEELAEMREAAEAVVAEAAREVEVLLKHRGKAEARFLSEAERKENLELEEIAASMFEARRRP